METELIGLVGGRTWLAYKLLGFRGEWLTLPAAEWTSNPKHVKLKATLQKLQMVNDPAE